MEGLEPEFNYDKEYINECMGWAPATIQNGCAPAGSNGHAGEEGHAMLHCACCGASLINSRSLFMAWSLVTLHGASNAPVLLEMAMLLL